jgi:site-specific DNA recombinase
MRLVALCRMSMASNELGNDRQEEANRRNAEAREHEIVAVKRDVMSATKFRLYDRPGWVEAVEMIQSGLADGVAVYHIDRLTRDNRDLEDVIDTGIPVVCASGEIDLATDMGRTVARVLVAIAKGEVERKSARQRLANEQRFTMGLPHAGGARTFGYENDGVTVNELEAEWFLWAVQEALAGGSMRSIGRRLDAAGMHSARFGTGRGKRNAGWTVRGVKLMLTNPRYAGLRSYQGQTVTGTWPTLIDMETHAQLRRLLLDPARNVQPDGRSFNSKKPVNLASLVAQCAVCDSPLIAGRGGAKPTYTCGSRKGCVYPPRQALDDAITDHILALLSAPGFVETLTPHNDERVQAATAQIDRLSKRLAVVRDDFNNGVYDDDEEEYRTQSADLRVKLKAAKQTIEDLAETQLFTGLSLGDEQVVDQWAELSVDRQRAIIGRLLVIKVKPSVGRGRYSPPWDAENQIEVTRRVAPAAV